MRGVVKVEVADVKAEVHPEDEAPFHSFDYRRKHEPNDGHLFQPHLQPQLKPQLKPQLTAELYLPPTDYFTYPRRLHLPQARLH